MVKTQKYINVIDIGSSKVTVLVAQKNPLKVIAFKNQPLTQLKHISINDPAYLSKVIGKLIDEIESEIPKYKIEKAFISINSFNTETHANATEKTLPFNLPVSKEDIEELTKKMLSVNFLDKRVLHLIPLQYLLDNSKLTHNPIGSFAGFLKMASLFITIPEQEYKTVSNMLRNCKIKSLKIINSPYATTLSFSDEIKKSEKTLIIEIGSHFTNLIYMKKGTCISIEVLNFGIANIIQSLVSQFKISEVEALNLIKENSCIMPNDAHLRSLNLKITKSSGDIQEETIELNKILPIITDMLNQYFEKIQSITEERKFTPINRVIITGGGANIAQINELATSYFKTEVITGIPLSIENFQGAGPEFSSLIGSLLSATKFNEEDILTKEKTFLEQVKDWIKENL